MDEGTTGPRKGPKVPEPEPEEPTSPAPPDRSRPTGGGTTNLPPNPVTTPSPPVAPKKPAEDKKPADDKKEPPKTAKPKKGRWSVKALLAAQKRAGGFGQAFAGEEAPEELMAYLEQQRQAEAARSARLQNLLQGRQTQPRVASARPGVR